MDEKIFIKKLVELMDTEAEINLSTKLSDLEDWDSLSMVAFFSFCNTNSNRRVAPDEIKAAQSVSDLFKLAGGESA